MEKIQSIGPSNVRRRAAGYRTTRHAAELTGYRLNEDIMITFELPSFTRPAPIGMCAGSRSWRDNVEGTLGLNGDPTWRPNSCRKALQYDGIRSFLTESCRMETMCGLGLASTLQPSQQIGKMPPSRP